MRWLRSALDLARRTRLVIVVVAGLIVVGVGSGTAFALWTEQRVSGSVMDLRTYTGFSVQRDGQPEDWATSPTDTVSFAVTTADVLDIIAAPTHMIAIPFTVSMLTSGTHGMNYSIVVGAGAPGTFLATATWIPMPVVKGGCSTAPTSRTATTEAGKYVGLAPRATPSGTAASAEQAWCLLIIRSLDSYTGKVSAVGTYPDGVTALPASASWSGTTGPDPALQNDVLITLSFVMTQYVGGP